MVSPSHTLTLTAMITTHEETKGSGSILQGEQNQLCNYFKLEVTDFSFFLVIGDFMKWE